MVLRWHRCWCWCWRMLVGLVSPHPRKSFVTLKPVRIFFQIELIRWRIHRIVSFPICSDGYSEWLRHEPVERHGGYKKKLLMIFLRLKGWGEANPTKDTLAIKKLLMIFLRLNIQNIWQQLLAAFNRAACIRHQCRKTTVLRCHRCLIYNGVEKMNNI